ncbi:MAG: LapA family protein [Geodermatophilaceae bacterium]|jgi:Tfp pilus assembly protein PilX
MSFGLALLIAVVIALVVGWLVMAYREPPSKRRISADYRHQQTENPDYFPGHAGGATGA